MPEYVFDTSIWVHIGRVHPPDIYTSFWAHLEAEVRRRLIASPEDVKIELRRGSDELAARLEAIEGLFIPLDSELMTSTREILGRYPALADIESERDRADPFVVALARQLQATVVTNEKPRRPASSRLKIPDVCSALSIPCIDWFSFLRATGWQP